MDITEEEAIKVLEKAKKYIEQGWCQNYPAIDDEGLSVLPMNDNAVAWCATGALEKALLDMYLDTYPIEQKSTLQMQLRTLSKAEEEVFADSLTFYKRKLDKYCKKLELSDGTGFDLISLNDDEGTTKEDIIDIFSKAISLAKR